jgi:pilus assembly protein TadC
LPFVLTFFLAKQIPSVALKNRRAMLESDLLYSARHLLLRLESGSSLLNSLESVSKLNTKSGLFFKELIFDIDMGLSLENSIARAIENSPSKAYTKLLEEIHTSLKTGTDLQRVLRLTLDDITRLHLIQIEEYGKKLNPMTMFYMIIGTILPSLGTAMLVVGASFLGAKINIDLTVLLSFSAIVLAIQVFFVLMFRALKPMVME